MWFTLVPLSMQVEAVIILNVSGMLRKDKQNLIFCRTPINQRKHSQTCPGSNFLLLVKSTHYCAALTPHIQ